MVDRKSTRTKAHTALALLTAASALVGCSQGGPYLTSDSTEASGSSMPPGTAWASSAWPNETSPDPYHYLCTGSCLRSF